jgi:putative tryptophan/tyrosine transport system substrate-binding protein
MMDRRRVLIASFALAAPGCLLAQKAKLWRIGFLSSQQRPASLNDGSTGAFLQGMRELGYVEGKNVEYEWRFAEGTTERLPVLAAELVRLNPDVIVTGGTPPTRAVQKATRTIPIVMAFTGDPVGSGLVASLARPGGNVTGSSNLNVEMNAKRVELLVRILPKLSRVAALLNPANPTYPANLAGMQAGAQKSKVTLLPTEARTTAEIERAFFAIKQHKAEAVIVHIDQLFMTNAQQVAELAVSYRLPLIGPRQMLEFGGLMSYVPDLNAAYRRVGSYVDRILKGALPADLPVEQPTKLELTISLKAAKSLGIPIPPEVMLLADEVIQ